MNSSLSLEARLRARIARQYDTTTELLDIAGLRVRFARIRRPDDVLDRIVEEEDRRERTTGVRKSGDELHLPYWAELWESGLGLGEYLVRKAEGFGVHQAELRAVESVLDLGCGMGLCGTVAAALGARVMLVDLETAALLLAQLNTLPFADRVRVRRLDWRRERLEERFDLILGSDVLYERKQWEFLEPFWRDHLDPNGAVLVAEPGRQTGDAFPAWINARGWRLETILQSIAPRPVPIRIFHLNPR